MKILENKSLCSLDGEVWMPVPLCEGEYAVSNVGRVKSIGREYLHPIKGVVYVSEKILSQRINNKGYYKCQISINRVKQKMYVHRIVCAAFIQNTDNKPQVNHKNGFRADNRIENLEWCTSSENNYHAVRELGRKSPKAMLGRTGYLSPFSKEVCCTTLNISFGSAKEAGRVLGISQGSISRICNGIRRSTDGLTFRYTT